MVRTAKAEATAETILLAAAEEFARSGYAGTTFESILKRLDKRTPNYITYHYKTKADLAHAILTRQDELWNTYIEALTDEGAVGVEALVAVFFVMLGDTEHLPIFQAALVLDSDLAAPHHGGFRPCAAWLRLVTDRLNEARTHGQLTHEVDADEEAWMIVSTLYGIYQLGQQLDPATRLTTRFERAWQQLLTGLGISDPTAVVTAGSEYADRYLLTGSKPDSTVEHNTATDAHKKERT